MSESAERGYLERLEYGKFCISDDGQLNQMLSMEFWVLRLDFLQIYEIYAYPACSDWANPLSNPH